MYDLECLPIARSNMAEIAGYVSRELQNPDAAEQLAEKMIDAVEDARTFPYAAPPYIPLRPLKHDYRKLLVQNHLIFLLGR